MDFNGILGITVQPQKMTADEAVKMMDEYGYDKFVLDSDMSSSPSDPLSVPKTVHQLRLAGVEAVNIKKVSYTNAADFYQVYNQNEQYIYIYLYFEPFNAPNLVTQVAADLFPSFKHSLRFFLLIKCCYKSCCK